MEPEELPPPFQATLCAVELECRSAQSGAGEWFEGLVSELAKRVFAVDDAIIELTSIPTSGGACAVKEASERMGAFENE